ncbi:MAG: hypothetical protein WC222_06610 [Parachlamydiales bacterium]|jgi:hypothetical protein
MRIAQYTGARYLTCRVFYFSNDIEDAEDLSYRKLTLIKIFQFSMTLKKIEEGFSQQLVLIALLNKATCEKLKTGYDSIELSAYDIRLNRRTKIVAKLDERILSFQTPPRVSYFSHRACGIAF